jgi:NitT/TauT family transport system substrate-binding protein
MPRSPLRPRHRPVSRRQFLRLTGLGLAAGGLSACGVPAAPTPAASRTAATSLPLKIGYIPITDATPLLIAYHQNFFADEGLTVEPPTLIRSWSALSEAFMAHTFNLVHLLLPITVFMRYSLKYPVKVVAWDHLNNSAITVDQDGPIQSLADLGGRQIAVPYWYSMHNIILQLAARTYGLEPVIQEVRAPLAAHQVNLVMMNPPDMPTALSTHAIDGYIVAEPFNAAGELLAGGKIIRFTGDIWKNHPCCVAVLDEDQVTQNPAWSQKVVNAIVRAELWARTHKEETARILSKEGSGYLPLPEAVVQRAMLKYDLDTYGPQGTGAIRHPEWEIARIGFSPYQFKADTRRMVELLKQTLIKGETEFLNTLSADRVVEELMNYRLVTQAVEAQGGLSQFDGVNAQTPYEREAQIEV